MRLRDRYDAVVVGAGHAGPVAAARLARAGRSVLVPERLPVAGGAAGSRRVPGGRAGARHLLERT